MKTVVSIKSDQPVTVVNYTETFDNETTNDKTNQENKSFDEKDNAASPEANGTPDLSTEDLEDALKPFNGEMEFPTENCEAFNTAVDSSIS